MTWRSLVFFLLIFPLLNGCTRSYLPSCRDSEVYDAILRARQTDRAFVRLELVNDKESGFDWLPRSKGIAKLGASDETLASFRAAVVRTGGIFAITGTDPNIAVLSDLELRSQNLTKLRTEELWTFSAVGFDSSCRNAVVFIDNDCGGLCGYEEFAALAWTPNGWKLSKDLRTPK